MSDLTQDCGCGPGAARTPLPAAPSPYQSQLTYRVGEHGSFLGTMTAGIAADPSLSRLTTRDMSDPALALLDSWATVLDVLTFYQERIANEGFLGTAAERRSLLELGTLIDYELAPGVSAETYLAFTTDEIPGSPTEVAIPKGAKVQSIPFEDGELPQTFETSEDLTAYSAVNDMRLELALYIPPQAGDDVIYLDVAAARLAPGDAIVILGDERKASASSRRWQVRRVLSSEVVAEDPVSHQPARAVVTLEKPLDGADRLPQTGIRAYAFRQRASLFGHNAQPWATLPISLRVGELLPGISVLAQPLEMVANPIMAMETSAEAGSAQPVMRARAPGAGGMVADISVNELFKSPVFDKLDYIDGSNNSLIKGPFADRQDSWAEALFPADDPYIYLDQVYDKFVAGGWLVLRKAVSGGTDEELYFIEEVAEVSHADFNQTAKVTRLKVSGTGLDKFSPRNATVFGANELVPWGRKPITEPISGLTLRLEKPVDELAVGQLLSIRGTAAETGKPAAMVGAIDSLASVPAMGSAQMQDSVTNTTEITLTLALAPALIRNTVRINGNVVAASHGETRAEPVGSGDATKRFQIISLPAKPLTHVSAAGESGRQSTLALRVNDILWREVPNFLKAGPKERVFTQSIDDAGTVSLTFGDGVTGARVPTGTANIMAEYRIGTGLAGLLTEDRLTQPMTRPVGLRSVTNPLPTAGAEDAETLESARQNAPVTVKTLGRIVSLADYEDFARAFAGIAKAKVAPLWDGGRTVVHLTIAGANGTVLGPGDTAYQNLVEAIDLARPRGQPIRIDSAAIVPFTVDAEIWVHPDYLVQNVLANVRAVLESAYDLAHREFAQPVAASEVVALAQGVEGVEGVTLLAFYRPPVSPTVAPPVEPLLLAEPARFENGVYHKAELLTLSPSDLTVREAAS